jgi:hypothetical protein
MVSPDLPVLKEFKVYREQLAPLVRKEFKVLQDQPVPQALLVQRDPQVLKAFKVRLEPMELHQLV